MVFLPLQGNRLRRAAEEVGDRLRLQQGGLVVAGEQPSVGAECVAQAAFEDAACRSSALDLVAVEQHFRLLLRGARRRAVSASARACFSSSYAGAARRSAPNRAHARRHGRSVRPVIRETRRRRCRRVLSSVSTLGRCRSGSCLPATEMQELRRRRSRTRYVRRDQAGVFQFSEASRALL